MKGPCSTCGADNRYAKSGACKPCARKRSNRAYREDPAHRERAKEMSRARSKRPDVKAKRSAFMQTPKQKARMVKYRRKWLYGLSPAEQDALMAQQDGLCGSCGDPFKSPRSVKSPTNMRVARCRMCTAPLTEIDTDTSEEISP